MLLQPPGQLLSCLFPASPAPHLFPASFLISFLRISLTTVRHGSKRPKSQDLSHRLLALCNLSPEIEISWHARPSPGCCGSKEHSNETERPRPPSGPLSPRPQAATPELEPSGRVQQVRLQCPAARPQPQAVLAAERLEARPTVGQRHPAKAREGRQGEQPQTSQGWAAAFALRLGAQPLLPIRDKTSAPQAPRPENRGREPGRAPGPGELIPTASRRVGGSQAAGDASHWTRSRLGADWLRLPKAPHRTLRTSLESSCPASAGYPAQLPRAPAVPAAPAGRSALAGVPTYFGDPDLAAVPGTPPDRLPDPFPPQPAGIIFLPPPAPTPGFQFPALRFPSLQPRPSIAGHSQHPICRPPGFCPSLTSTPLTNRTLS